MKLLANTDFTRLVKQKRLNVLFHENFVITGKKRLSRK